MKKVLMIVQNDFVNDSRIIKEANTLGKNGYEVLVLALYREKLKKKERFDFFDVERIQLFTRDKLSNRIIYLQFIKYIEFYNKCVNRAKIFVPDIVHCHDMSTLPIGRKIQKITGCKFIYDSHELWSHSTGVSKYPKFLLKHRNNLEKRAAIKSDVIITVSESIANKLREQFSLDRKPIVIRNIPRKKDITEKQNIFRNKFSIPANKKIILYQGGISKGRGIEKIIESMPYIDNNIVYVILGNGVLTEHLKELAIKLRVEDRVFFHEAVSQEILLNYTNSADLGVHLMENTCLNHYYALPNKIFEYIQAELPILCSNFPEMRKIVLDYNIGEIVDPDDKEGIARSINKILLDKNKLNFYKRNCLKAKTILNWENEEEILLNLYRKMG